MPTLTLYLPKETFNVVKVDAATTGISVSKKISDVVKTHYQKQGKKVLAAEFSKLIHISDVKRALKEMREERSHDRI